MQINGISRNISKPVNFTGEFRIKSEKTYSDETQRYEVTKVHSIYYPNKGESEKEIREAMKAYTRTESGFGHPSWDYSTEYTCERGGRLPY